MKPTLLFFLRARWLCLTGRRPRIRWAFVRQQLRAARWERPHVHRIVCSRCQDCLRRGDPRLPVSHGICPSCRDQALFASASRFARPAAYQPARR